MAHDYNEAAIILNTTQTKIQQNTSIHTQTGRVRHYVMVTNT